MKTLLTLPALAELQEAIEYYEKQQPGLSGRFLDEVEACRRRIENFPLAWQPLDETFRRCRLNHFPYGLIYRMCPEHIEIMAVAHLHRRPLYWKDRQ
ncbi:type II toxin-antitoxin system RelE/ParE family toxin [Sulfurivirga sp.]|uniref:type II toxin-antitoxin system RelE/ParE family toxin n=1 Tax=Sulfurivirga sp. TaxID=2614236 RepID=UPI0025D3A181|nr:type II toxin-antitoxin system RelE/ParE family toxin [Sulfurivirga sp.]